MLYDDPRELNFTMAYDNHIMDEGYTSLDERRERYARVTPERVRDAAREIFKKENLTLTMKGIRRKTDTEKINEILKGFE